MVVSGSGEVVMAVTGDGLTVVVVGRESRDSLQIYDQINSFKT